MTIVTSSGMRIAQRPDLVRMRIPVRMKSETCHRISPSGPSKRTADHDEITDDRNRLATGYGRRNSLSFISVIGPATRSRNRRTSIRSRAR